MPAIAAIGGMVFRRSLRPHVTSPLTTKRVPMAASPTT